MKPTILQSRGFFLLALVALGCAGSTREIPPPIPEPANSEIEHSVYLIGDGGNPAETGEPVLVALTALIQEHPSPSTVVFLGDNIYRQGLPDSAHADRAEMERRIDAQVDVVLATEARGIFIPGNHDWAASGSDGWAAVLRQEERIEDRGFPQVEQLPDGGCPGPEVVDLGASIRLVVLDTQWWLHNKEKPRTPDDGCNPFTREGVVESLATVLAESGSRHVIVVGHHPPDSNGPHGGYFTWKQHIFPLTEAVSWLYLPIPIIGSAYPISRQSGISDQDQSSSGYEDMFAALDSALVTTRPLVFAGGHEHVIEVLEGASTRYVLVSGLGYYGHGSRVAWRDETLFASSEAGFMRLDSLRDGSVRLGVFQVDGEGLAVETFSTVLE